MNTSGDAAESIVRMSLQGLEVAVKLSGSGAKNIAAIMIAMLKDQKQTKGKTRLTSMLKSGKELKVFTVKEEDLRKFTEEAKRYGVLFCALKGKGKSLDGMVDIMVRQEDAPKVNRIVDRFKLSAFDIAEIKSELEKDKIEEMIKDAKERGVEVKSDEEKLADDIMSKPIQKEGQEQSNPNVAKTEKSPLSEPSLENKNNSGVVSKLKKPSVRETLKEIKRELKEKAEESKENKEIAKERKEVNDTKAVDDTIPSKKELKKSSKGKER